MATSPASAGVGRHGVGSLGAMKKSAFADVAECQRVLAEKVATLVADGWQDTGIGFIKKPPKAASRSKSPAALDGEFRALAVRALARPRDLFQLAPAERGRPAYPPAQPRESAELALKGRSAFSLLCVTVAQRPPRPLPPAPTDELPYAFAAIIQDVRG